MVAVVDEMVDIQQMVEELQHHRRDIAPHIPHAPAELRERWHVLELAWDDLRRMGAEALQSPGDSSEAVWDAVVALREELRDGYTQLKRSL